MVTLVVVCESVLAAGGIIETHVFLVRQISKHIELEQNFFLRPSLDAIGSLLAEAEVCGLNVLRLRGEYQ